MRMPVEVGDPFVRRRAYAVHVRVWCGADGQEGQVDMRQRWQVVISSSLVLLLLEMVGVDVYIPGQFGAVHVWCIRGYLRRYISKEVVSKAVKFSQGRWCCKSPSEMGGLNTREPSSVKGSMCVWAEVVGCCVDLVVEIVVAVCVATF
jgi:hypothetical protein